MVSTLLTFRLLETTHPTEFLDRSKYITQHIFREKSNRTIFLLFFQKLILSYASKAVNLIIKLFFPYQMGISFFLLLRFFSRKIEVWRPKNHNFEIFFVYKKYVNFINNWRWPKNFRCGKSLYFDHVTTKIIFHTFFSIYY